MSLVCLSWRSIVTSFWNRIFVVFIVLFGLYFQEVTLLLRSGRSFRWKYRFCIDSLLQSFCHRFRISWFRSFFCSLWLCIVCFQKGYRSCCYESCWKVLIDWWRLCRTFLKAQRFLWKLALPRWEITDRLYFEFRF